MTKQLLKNAPREAAFLLREHVEVLPGQVVSKTLAQNQSLSITLFAFDKGEEIRTHTSDGDAMLTVLEGDAKITVGGKDHALAQGQTIVMPAQVPHAVAAENPFKMILIVVFSQPD
jgi:quercetin dioxygenase-like cupin family protein